ncbi:hypothetical protein CBM2614_B150083 [Cupriavidus taiwanensis]|nr:hypothetical protein CBM2614_B150083 [Cupriavidus taiwanensis]
MPKRHALRTPQINRFSVMPGLEFSDALLSSYYIFFDTCYGIWTQILGAKTLSLFFLFF